MKYNRSIIFNYLPKNSAIYRICKHYVDSYNNENNRDMRTNGELNVLRKYLSNSSIVFDVGANEGEWSFHALNINPNIYIHCFEPGTSAYAQLIERDFPRNVICNNFGFSSIRQSCPMYVANGNSRISSLYKRSGLENILEFYDTGTENIVLDTIDNYCKQRGITRIDYLKLDIEGHELEAIKGAQELLSRSAIKVIQFEYGGCNIDAKVLLKDIFDFFSGLPYHFYKIFPDQPRPFKQYSQRLENFQYQNWLILHNDIH